MRSKSFHHRKIFIEEDVTRELISKPNISIKDWIFVTKSKVSMKNIFVLFVLKVELIVEFF